LDGHKREIPVTDAEFGIICSPELPRSDAHQICHSRPYGRAGYGDVGIGLRWKTCRSSSNLTHTNRGRAAFTSDRWSTTSRNTSIITEHTSVAAARFRQCGPHGDR
jgi:hypothetical protein